MMFLGNPEFECDLTDIDFARIADAMGLTGFHVDDPAEAARVTEAALAHPGAALIEAVIDPNEPFLPPKRMQTYVENLRRRSTKPRLAPTKSGRRGSASPPTPCSRTERGGSFRT
jgi:hypothetical protein